MRLGIIVIDTDLQNCNHDGVNLAQREIQRAIIENTEIEILTHSIIDLLYNDKYFKSLRKADTILCNIDPFAYLYMYIRELIGGDYRIIRSVQTGPWNGYLLQEALCTPFTRDDDIILHISEYTRTAYAKCRYDYMLSGQHIVCYPETIEHPKEFYSQPLCNRKYLAAYIGRISYDKGFDIALDCMTILSKEFHSAHFVIAGAPHPDDYKINELLPLIHQKGLASHVDYLGNISSNNIFKLLTNSSCLIFPSTSNIESLGRVILEAKTCGTPVLAARHAATPELMEKDALISPRYQKGFCEPTNHHYPLGAPNPQDFAEKILDRNQMPLPKALQYRGSDICKFFDILLERDYHYIAPYNTNLTYEGILEDLPSYNKSSAFEVCRYARDIIAKINNGDREAEELLAILVNVSPRKVRTMRFVKNTLKNGLDITDIGGIAMEICHILGFNPKLMLV